MAKDLDSSPRKMYEWLWNDEYLIRHKRNTLSIQCDSTTPVRMAKIEKTDLTRAVKQLELWHTGWWKCKAGRSLSETPVGFLPVWTRAYRTSVGPTPLRTASTQNLHLNVPGSSIHSNQNLETTRMATGGGQRSCGMTTRRGGVLIRKKEWTANKCNRSIMLKGRRET